jgi:hypothetical protein
MRWNIKSSIKLMSFAAVDNFDAEMDISSAWQPKRL